jgi:hypothetical protein
MPPVAVDAGLPVTDAATPAAAAPSAAITDAPAALLVRDFLADTARFEESVRCPFRAFQQSPCFW